MTTLNSFSIDQHGDVAHGPHSREICRQMMPSVKDMGLVASVELDSGVKSRLTTNADLGGSSSTPRLPAFFLLQSLFSSAAGSLQVTFEVVSL